MGDFNLNYRELNLSVVLQSNTLKHLFLELRSTFWTLIMHHSGSEITYTRNVKVLLHKFALETFWPNYTRCTKLTNSDTTI